MTEFACRFCNKSHKSKMSLSQHDIRCASNPDRIYHSQKWRDVKASKDTKRSNGHIKAKELGLIYNISEETKKKISISSIGKKHSEETKSLLSRMMKDRYANGFEVKCGRAPKYNYESPTAGLIKVDGSWELKVAVYLDSIGVSWKRNKQRFGYINLKGEESTYCPDFWVDGWDTFIEVKGYRTDLDECKWSQFKHKLLVWDKKTLKEMNIL
jgi:hypothetical protein